jgi:tripartite-type tricarboxylate transporter receptor subunit TctC
VDNRGLFPIVFRLHPASLPHPTASQGGDCLSCNWKCHSYRHLLFWRSTHIAYNSAMKSGVFFLLAIIVCSASAAAQPAGGRDLNAFPTKPIRFVVPFTPGGSNNALARLLAQKMSEHWGQQVIVDNRPAAGSIIGSEIVARAPADGYTILMIGQGYFLNPSLHKSLPYDSITDFARVTLLVSTPSVLAAHPSLKANTVRELFALARANPGKLNYASASIGSNGHLAMEIMASMGEVKFVHIPYKGGGDALTALISGEVQLVFTAPSSVIQQISSGRLRALGVSSAKRIASLPDVPAISETLPGYEVVNVHGVLAPAKTPRAIIDKLNAELLRILRLPDVSGRLATLGYDAVGNTPDEFDTFTRKNIQQFSNVLARAGIAPE